MSSDKTARSWRFADGQRLAEEFPYTFHKPSPEATKRLQPGDEVKLIFEIESDDPNAPNAERMWVEIVGRDGDAFEGRLDNDPAYISDIAVGDPVSFEARHIIQVSIVDPVPSKTAKYEQHCFVTHKVLSEGARIGYLYREQSEYDDDSGWRIAAGDESDEYMADTDNIAWVSLGAVLREDDSIVELLDAPVGTAFTRLDGKQNFTKIED